MSHAWYLPDMQSNEPEFEVTWNGGRLSDPNAASSYGLGTTLSVPGSAIAVVPMHEVQWSKVPLHRYGGMGVMFQQGDKFKLPNPSRAARRARWN